MDQPHRHPASRAKWMLGTFLRILMGVGQTCLTEVSGECYVSNISDDLAILGKNLLLRKLTLSLAVLSAVLRMPGQCNRHHPGEWTATIGRSKPMRDARYLRAQAEWCLELARQVSDRATCDNLCAEAARYHAEAAKIESDIETSVSRATPDET